jgi:hypothetical protein
MQHHLQILVAFDRLHEFRHPYSILRCDLLHIMISSLLILCFYSVGLYFVSAENNLVRCRALRLSRYCILLCELHYLLLNPPTCLRASTSMSALLSDNDLSVYESLLSNHKLHQISLVG